MKKKDKERFKERLYRLTWSSLESHLQGTYSGSEENKRFDKKCVDEYAEMIYLISKL